MKETLEKVNADLGKRYGVQLANRTGVNTGEVVASDDPTADQKLATGDAVNVTARLEAAAPLMGVSSTEGEAWITGFEFLQMLRLQNQLGDSRSSDENPNLVPVDTLNDIDRRMLKETMRIARRLQQRIELDYRR